MTHKRKVGEINGWGVFGLLIASITVLGVLTLIQNNLNIKQPETVLGIQMAQVVVALMVLLFIMAAGFALIGLSDPQQALGLPEGSIRALIALFLIMIFVTFGLYLFRTVGGQSSLTLHNLTADEVQQLGDKVIVKSPELSDATKYQVMILEGTSQEGVDLAKLLINTVGTLVVAVAGFYFGSRAVQAARGVATPDKPRIRSVDPSNKEKGTDPISITIIGDGFMMAETVKLVRGKIEIKADEVISNTSKIVASFKISDAPLDKDDQAKEKETKFDLVVINDDGGEDRLAEAFTIKPPSQSATPPVQPPATPQA